MKAKQKVKEHIPPKKKKGVETPRKMQLILNGTFPATLEVCYRKIGSYIHRYIFLSIFYNNDGCPDFSEEECTLDLALAKCSLQKKVTRPITRPGNYMLEVDKKGWDKRVEVLYDDTKRTQPLDVIFDLIAHGIGVKEVTPPEEEKYKKD